MSDILIKRMEMPKSCEDCMLESYCGLWVLLKDRPSRHPDCPLVPIPPHGRLIDADALIADIKRQCREVFRVDAVSPDDFWITRNEAYNERLWETWCESFFGYLRTRPTVIEAEEMYDDQTAGS